MFAGHRLSCLLFCSLMLSSPAAGQEPGVRFAAWTERLFWPSDEQPRLLADLSHRGSRELMMDGPFELSCDGVWYVLSRGVSPRIERFMPQRDYRDLVFPLDSRWRRRESGRPLTLTRGRHHFRFAFRALADRGPAAVPVRLVSEAVDVHILSPGERVSNTRWLAFAAGGRPGFRYTRGQVMAMVGRADGPDHLQDETADRLARAAMGLAGTSGADPHQVTDALERALALDQPVDVEARLFLSLGDSLRRQVFKHVPTLWRRQRRIAAEAYLTGLRRLLAHGVPEEAPALPVVPIRSVAVLTDGASAHNESNRRQITAPRRAEQLGDLVWIRRALVGQLVDMYKRPPASEDELRSLLGRHLPGDDQAEKILKAAFRSRDHRSELNE